MDIQLLDDDCLLHIFQYLTLLDIIKLEESSQIFEEAAKMYYRSIKKFECNIRNIELQDLTPILTRIGPYLTTFSFSGGFVMPKEYKRTLTLCISKHCKSLKSLSLNYVPLESSDLENLIEVTSNLEKLNLGNCHLGDSDLEFVLSKCSKNLKRLTLNGNPLMTGECLTKLDQIEKLDVSYCYALLTMHLCQFLRQSRKLKCLNVSGSFMLDWKEVFKVLTEYQSNIEELYMLNLGVDETQVPYQSFKHLKVFDIKGRRLGT